MISMGLNPDLTPIEDLYLVTRQIDETGRQVGIVPSKDVVEEYNRTRNYLLSGSEKSEAELAAEKARNERMSKAGKKIET